MAPKPLDANRDLLTDRSARAFVDKGCLKRGVSIHAASDEAEALAKSLGRSYPSTNRTA
jgi:hypothetical protein